MHSAVVRVRLGRLLPPLLSSQFQPLICPSLWQIAEGEAKAGHAGSKALRAAALRCLRRLIDAVGDGDVLAFVLPGVASGLLRALLVAGAPARYCRAVASCMCNALHCALICGVLFILCQARAIDRACAPKLPGL